MSVAQPRVELLELVRRYLDGFQLLGLFSNAHRPTDRDRVEDYVELEGGGYRALMVQGPEWALELEDGPAVLAQAPEQAFRFEAPTAPVYGYYLRDALTGRLLWAEAWENEDGELTPIRPDLPGFEIRVRPRYQVALAPTPVSR